MKIALVNVSNKVNGEELDAMVRAIRVQIDSHFAPAWWRRADAIGYFETLAQVPPSQAPILIGDKADVQNALGYHSQVAGKPFGKVFRDVILAAGGTMLGDPKKPTDPSVSSTLSHEVLELLGDPWANAWSQGPKVAAGSMYAQEVGDPCQEWGYPIEGCATSPVMVSDFVLPTWFDADLPPGAPVDFMAKLTAPFTITEGGYCIISDGKRETAVFGQAMPEWLRAEKLARFSRTSRRGAKQ